MATVVSLLVILSCVAGSVFGQAFTFPDNTTFWVNGTRYLMYFFDTKEWLFARTLPRTRFIDFIDTKRTQESVSVHYAWNQKVISERGTKTIVVYKSTTGKAVYAHVGTSPLVGHVTVDWLSNNVYWTDPGFGWIGLQALKEDLSRFAVNAQLKVVVSSSLETPYGVSVLPQIKRLFWSDHGSTPKLESSDLLGMDRRVLVWRGLSKPTAVCADHTTLRLFWVDETKGTVESCDFEGKGRRIVISAQASSSLGGLQAFENNIIVSDRNRNELQAYNKETGRVAAPAIPGAVNAGDIAVFSSALQPRDNVTCNASSCDHICIHDGGCVCASGYAIASDGKTCTERTTSLWKSFLVSTGSQICAVPVNLLFSHRYLPPKQVNNSVNCFLSHTNAGGDSIGFLAVDSLNATLYYTLGRRLCRYHIHNGSDVALTSASGDILGMACDWLSGKLVWTQRSPLQAVYSLARNSSTPVAVYQNLKKPSHITVDPYRGSMFWIESPDGMAPQIKSGTVNGTGSKRTVLTTGLTRPQHLTYDHRTDKLYWIDVDHVGVIDPDGTKKHIVTLSSLDSYRGLAIFRSYIMWSTTKSGAKEMTFRNVEFTETDNLTSFKVPDKIDDVTNIVFYDASVNLDSGMVSCELDNGGCSQLCIVDGASFHCRCYFGFRLHQDGVTCTSDPVTSNLFLVADTLSNQIYQIRGDNKAVAAVPLQKGARPELVVYNWVTRDIIWYDSKAGAIKLSFLDGRSVRVVRSLREAGQTISSRVGALCVDHSANNLFFTEIRADNSKGWIRVISLHTLVMRTLYESSAPPRLLAIAPTKGKLVFGTDIGTIYLSDMAMDSTPTQLESGITKLSGLVFSDGGTVVQWSDDEADGLWRMSLGTRAKERRLHKSGSHPRALFAWGSTLYYITTSRRSVNTLSSTGAENTVLQFPEFGRLSSLEFFGQQAPQVRTGCSERNGRCSTLCIPAPDSRRHCQCADGVNLLTDKRTCSDVERCTNQVRNGHLSDTCDRFPRETCSYTCQEGYTANPSAPHINCSSSGQWNPSTDSLCLRTCPLSVRNGQIRAGCPLAAGTSCEVTCDAGFTVAETALPKVTCGQDGKWTVSSDRMCQKSEEEEPLPVWAIGVISAGVVVLLAVLLGCVLYRRMKKFGRRDSNRQPISIEDFARFQAGQQTGSPAILVTPDLGEGATGGKEAEEEYAELDDVAEEAARYQSFSKISPVPGKRRTHVNGGLHNGGFDYRYSGDYVQPNDPDYSRSLTRLALPGQRRSDADYLTPALAQSMQRPESENGDYLTPFDHRLSSPEASSLYPSPADGYSGSLRHEAVSEPHPDYMHMVAPSSQPAFPPEGMPLRKMSRSDWTA